MVAQDFCKCPPGVAHPHGIGVEVVRDEDQRLPERPAAPARPGGVVHPQRGPKDAAALGGEGVPRHHQIAGRIAYAQRPKVDNGAQPTLLKEQIPWQQVPVEPDRGAIPLRGLQGGLPHCRGCFTGTATIAKGRAAEPMPAMGAPQPNGGPPPKDGPPKP